MGFLRFRRRIKILPGIRLNIGKNSTSISVGPRGAHYTIGTAGSRVSVGLPGTGLSYSQIHKHNGQEAIAIPTVPEPGELPIPTAEWFAEQKQVQKVALHIPDRQHDEPSISPEQLKALSGCGQLVNPSFDLSTLGSLQAASLLDQVKSLRSGFSRERLKQFYTERGHDLSDETISKLYDAFCQNPPVPPPLPIKSNNNVLKDIVDIVHDELELWKPLSKTSPLPPNQTYVLQNDHQFGPFTDDEIQERLKDGFFSNESLCSREGWPDWRPLGVVFPKQIDNDSQFLFWKRIFGVTPEEKAKKIKYGALMVAGGLIVLTLQNLFSCSGSEKVKSEHPQSTQEAIPEPTRPASPGSTPIIPIHTEIDSN